MTPNELINSGLLELYVSGTLPEADNLLISKMAIEYSIVHEEIKRIENSLIAALENENYNISDQAKNKIFEAVKIIPNNAETKVVALSKRRNFINWAAAAMLVLLIGSGFLISILSKQKNQLAAQKTQVETDNETLLSRNSFLQSSIDKAANDLSILRSHDFKKIMLMPVASNNHEMACVYWNPITHKLFVDNCGLANPGEGKTFQLWAMKNGKPINVGVFNQDMYNKGLQEFASVDVVESFAVTIENAAVAAEPNLAALQVAGKI
jgi:cell division protein FtsB